MLLRSIQLIGFLPNFIQASPILVKRLYPDPEPCLGNCSWVHDPSIYVQNGTYYRFSTSGNIAVATAKNMKGPWTYQGALLQKGTKIRIDGERQDVWAPTVVKINTTFYCYYSVSYLSSQSSQIGFATSPSLSLNLSSWTDHGTLHIPHSPSYNLIDPAVFQEAPNAPIYMTFGSYWSGIFSLRVPPSTLSYRRGTLGSPQDLQWSRNVTVSGISAITQGVSELKNLIRNTTTDADVVEGAFMYHHRGSYFLFFSAGACCAVPPYLAPPGREYRILVCKAATAMGPFSDREGRRCDDSGGTLVLGSHGDVYAPGGQGVMFDVGVGRTVMYYHYGECVVEGREMISELTGVVRPSVGYVAELFFFGFNYLEWVGGWPVVVRSEEGKASSTVGSITGVLRLAYKKLGLSFEGRPAE